MQHYLAIVSTLLLTSAFNESQMKIDIPSKLHLSSISTESFTQAEQYLERAYKILHNGADPREALRLANISISLQESSKAYTYSAFAKNILDDKAGAISDYTRSLQIDPSDKVSYYNRGLIKSNQGDRHGAIADFNKAIQIDPSDGSIFDARGDAYFELGRTNEACSDYVRAISLGNERSTRWFFSPGSFWCRDNNWDHPSSLTADALHFQSVGLSRLPI